MRAVVVALAALVCLVQGLPAPNFDLQVQTLLADPPGLVGTKDELKPDENGINVVRVVNVHKRAVILVHSQADERGATRRALIRETWLQCLNRTNEFALPSEARRSFSVWFIVPVGASGVPPTVIEEGKLNGDILTVKPPENSYFAPSRIEEMNAALKWVRVKYFERFDMLVLVDDDSFVSIPNLLDFHENHKNDPYFYSGSINSFERADEGYQHKYYAPFAELGAIVLSRDLVELLSREFDVMKKYPRIDVTIGHFFMPYLKPFHSEQFIAKLGNVYAEISNPIVICHVEPILQQALAIPKKVDGKFVYPPLPAQTEELASRSVFVDPHPKDDYPECDAMATGKCNFSNLKMVDELKH